MVFEVSGIPQLLPSDVEHMTLCLWRDAKGSGHATSHFTLRQQHDQTNRYCPKFNRRSFSESSTTSLSAKPPLFWCCRFSWRKPASHWSSCEPKALVVSPNERSGLAEPQWSIASDHHPAAAAAFSTRYQNSDNKWTSEISGNCLNREKKKQFFARKQINLMATKENIKFSNGHKNAWETVHLINSSTNQPRLVLLLLFWGPFHF